MSKLILNPVYGDMSVLVIDFKKGDTIKQVMDEVVGDDEYPQWYGYENLKELFENKPNDFHALGEWFCEHNDYSDFTI